MQTLYVAIPISKSIPVLLNCGISQGSVSGLILFTIFTRRLGDAMSPHNTKFHLYVGYTQLYITTDWPSNTKELEVTLKGLEAVTVYVQYWMPMNGLKLNDSKTEFLTLLKTHSALFLVQVQIGSDSIDVYNSARNVGVIFNECLSLWPSA